MPDSVPSDLFFFNDFLASLALPPLGLQFKEIAFSLEICESTLSKLRHKKLKKIPGALGGALGAKKFADRFFQNWRNAESLEKLLPIYGLQLTELYSLSADLQSKLGVMQQAAEAANGGQQDCCRDFLEGCYLEAYSNSSTRLIKTGKEKGEVSKTAFQNLCNLLKRDLLDETMLSDLLKELYEASLRKNLLISAEPGMLEMVRRMVLNQKDKPYFKKSQRTEIVSISEDGAFLTKKISVREELILFGQAPILYLWKETLYHAPQDTFPEKPEKYLKSFFCMVDDVPLEGYLKNRGKGKAMYSPFRVEHRNDELCGNQQTSLLFSFLLYPKEKGEPVTIRYEAVYTLPLVPNISVNYCYRLPYACKFLDHECILDSGTRKRWGLRVKLFVPLVLQENAENSIERSYRQNYGSLGSKRVTFYDWAPAGSGYFRNLFELKYSNG